MGYEEIFESELFKKALEQVPEKDREQMVKSLKEFADLFYNRVIKPLEKS